MAESETPGNADTCWTRRLKLRRISLYVSSSARELRILRGRAIVYGRVSDDAPLPPPLMCGVVVAPLSCSRMSRLLIAFCDTCDLDLRFCAGGSAGRIVVAQTTCPNNSHKGHRRPVLRTPPHTLHRTHTTTRPQNSMVRSLARTCGKKNCDAT